MPDGKLGGGGKGAVPKHSISQDVSLKRKGVSELISDPKS